MVQMQAPKSLASQAGLKRNHCQRLEQQDTRSRGGGGGDIKSQSSLATSPPLPLTRMPSYMKPTISSNARKENLQVTTTIHSRPAAATDEKKRSRNTKDSALSINKQYYSSKATCTSTLKDSKFPKALDLVAGGTEAQGSSLTKVCPYAYCSLNGHHHQPPLPPLKRFVSARRKSLKNQKSTELEEEEDGAGEYKKKETASDDFFFVVDIKIKTEDETETPDVLRYEDDDDDDADQNSEPSSDEEDMMYERNFLEYVECDQRVEEEVHVPSKISEEEDEVEESERVPTVEEVEESSLPDNRSECSDEGFGLPTPYCEEEEEAPEDGGADNTDSNEGGDLCRPSASTSKGDYHLHINWGIVDSVLESHSKEAVSEEPEEDAETENTLLDGPEVQVLVVGDGTSSSSAAQHSDSCDNFTEPEQATAEEGDHIQTEPEMQDFKCNGEVEYNRENFKGIEKEQQEEIVDIDEMKARMRIVRKKMTTEEQQEEEKEFNPRGARFLAVEPDPEAEKVDLRHQMMDEKKNSEEWMIDYALRQALMKLAPAPKRKVSLLVQAFESVTPLHDWEKATSGFGHARIIQACN